MLQVTSGKFYKTDELRSYEGIGISYSNFNWIIPIKTCVATLQPVETNYSSITSYIIKYTNQIENKGAIGGLLDSEIIEQFQLLCIFGLKSFFNSDKSIVEQYCRVSPKGSETEYVPSKFVNQFFDIPVVGSNEDAKNFVKFVEKVIDLPREKYIVVIDVLKAFSHSLQFLDSNIDLSYSIMIYCIESLAQNFDEYKSNWKDYDPSVKSKLDKLFEKHGLGNGITDEIRQLLLSSSNSKLKQRFVEFTEKYVTDEFFKSEADGIKNPLRKSDLKQVLDNAYKMRSEYVHGLKEIEKHIKIDNLIFEETTSWEDKRYLTYRGLVRLVHHVISTFIKNQEILKIENGYDWYNNLPQTIQMYLHPKYWVGDANNFSPNGSIIMLSGFLEYLSYGLLNDEKIIPLVGLCLKIEQLIESGVKKEYKLPMMAFYLMYNINIESSNESLVHQLYLKDYEDLLEKGLKYVIKTEYQPPMVNIYSLYNQIIFTKHKAPNYHSFLDKHADILDNCCIESIITYLMIGKELPWEIDEIEKHYRNYKKKKYNKLSLTIPPIFELFISINIANAYLREDNIICFNKWIDLSILDHPGNLIIQKYIEKNKIEQSPIDFKKILDLYKTA